MKKLFQTEKNKDWDVEWLDDLKNLNITWASAYLNAYQFRNIKSFFNEKKISEDDWAISQKLRINGIPDKDVNKRRVYFETTSLILKQLED